MIPVPPVGTCRDDKKVSKYAEGLQAKIVYLWESAELFRRVSPAGLVP